MTDRLNYTLNDFFLRDQHRVVEYGRGEDTVTRAAERHASVGEK